MSQKSKKKAKAQSAEAPIQATRETVESVIVAFVLAFLFRAFVAEAFVIPTGSMAPTLMGAHKDVFCEQCGQQFQNGASEEFDNETGTRTTKVAIAGCCSNCRALNKYDFRGNSNHATFSGDRILVSKFDYVVSAPDRWDVFVFKFPQNARMNYIKRLVGLPGESLRIQEGDVYLRQEGEQEWKIARKPHRKIKAMRRVVSDTSNPAPALVKAGWPANWQAFGSGKKNWETENTEDGWSGHLSASAETSQVRYFHKVPSVLAWEVIAAGDQIQMPGPLESQLVTDYLAYNCVVTTDTRAEIYDGNLRPEVTSENRAYDVIANRYAFSPASGLSNRGLHWVGDLMVEASVAVESESGQLQLDAVEHGVRYLLTIDVATGTATLTGEANSGESVEFGGGTKLTTETSVQGKGNYRLGLCNFDDEITISVNGSVVDFGDTTFDSLAIRAAGSRRPYYSEDDPLDAAPLGIGGKNLAMKLSDIKVFRDIYYIADIPNSEYVTDLPLNAQLSAAIPDASVRLNPLQAIDAIYSMPQWWDSTNFFELRGALEFQIDERQYFPLGDNSARSSDARAWTGRNYVGQEYLLGKALLVFWPHTWNSPVPLTPNIHRMGLIR